MQFSVLKTWTREVPAEWETALRAISPISRVVPWLALRWFPCRRAVDGIITDCGRWLLSECVPEEVIPENERDILQYLSGPMPSNLPLGIRRNREAFCNDYQVQMYRTHRVWARELWIIQGEQGGHATDYDPTEREIRRIHGLSEDPPAVGDLPYAPFDQRVVQQMLRRNRLIRFKMSVDELRRQGVAEVTREMEAGMREAREEFVKFITEQSRATADLVTWYSGKSDHRDELPQATPQEQAAAARFADEFIDTGSVPTAA